MLAFVAIFALAFIPVLGGRGALLFLVAGSLLVLSRPGASLAGLREDWMFMLMGLWCLISFIWSDYPSLSLRYGIQLCLTVVIGSAIISRLTPTAFVKILFVTSSLEGIASLLSGRTRADGMGYLGIYASKNALASAMAMLIIVAIAVLIDRHLPRRWRLPALFSLLLGSMLMVMGKSAGALVSTFGLVLFLGLILLLQRLAPYVRLIAITLMLVLAVFVGLVISSMSAELAQGFLELTGKDITLTGRTDLWAVALEQIARHPLLGVGFQAFWVHGQPMAEQLWAQFGINSRAGFHFHNTLLSNTVEIGVIGTTLETVPFFLGVYLSVVWVLRSRSAASIFFALFMVRLVILMSIEVAYFYQFGTVTITIMAALRYGRAARRNGRSALPRHARPAPIPAARAALRRAPAGRPGPA
ncbi:O-antigen ligase family protein [Paracoccus contaminans]|uniref:O-antigen ligase family protein n=1 Tax=Paracoccus contaminans TaxID=1945662 RepID=UPI00146A9B12|nr:O-antigen ligase family protein [Paracoccus contaminans]